MKTRKMSLLNAAAGFAFGMMIMGATQAGAQDSCKAVNDAQAKVMTTPTHIYTTMTGVPNSADKHTTEVIYMGAASYVKVSGKWSTSPVTTQQVVKMEEENRKASNTTCQYVRDDVVNGEAAAVYSTHSERTNPNVKSDGQIWVSKSRGLVLKVEIDISGDGTTKHHSSRYEYANVQAPPIG